MCCDAPLSAIQLSTPHPKYHTDHLPETTVLCGDVNARKMSIARGAPVVAARLLLLLLRLLRLLVLL